MGDGEAVDLAPRRLGPEARPRVELAERADPHVLEERGPVAVARRQQMRGPLVEQPPHRLVREGPAMDEAGVGRARRREPRQPPALDEPPVVLMEPAESDRGTV